MHKLVPLNTWTPLCSFILSSGAHDFKTSYGISIYVSEAVTGISPTIYVKISIEEGLLETQHAVPKDEWILIIVNYLNGTLESHAGNTVKISSLGDVVPRSSPILYTESFSKLEVGGTGPSFRIGDLQVFNQLLTSDQFSRMKSYYEDNHCKCK